MDPSILQRRYEKGKLLNKRQAFGEISISVVEPKPSLKSNKIQEIILYQSKMDKIPSSRFLHLMMGLHAETFQCCTCPKPCPVWHGRRAGDSHGNAILAHGPSISTASHHPDHPDLHPGLGWPCWAGTQLKPPLARFGAQTCPMHSVLAQEHGNNADSTSLALSQELHHSILFNRKYMSFFICLLASKILELLTLIASFIFNFNNQTFS